MSNNDQLVLDLETIIRLMADIWPDDRDNIPQAGAKFEQVIESFDKNSSQIQRLIDLSWEGLKHLYEKDEYFMMVKSATMQAVNVIREYVLEDGNIKVEEFEKAYDYLFKSLKGDAESADTIIELSKEEEAILQKSTQNKTNVEVPISNENIEETRLDDLASFIISVDEADVNREEIQKLKAMLTEVANGVPEDISTPLTEAIEVIETKASGWLAVVSTCIERVIEKERQKEWQESEVNNTAVDATEGVSKNKNDNEPVKTEILEVKPESIEMDSEENDIFYIPVDAEISMIGEFITECSELIQMAEVALLDLEESPDDNELINTVFRAFHTIKGTSAFMGLQPITEFTHHVETLLSIVRDGELPFDRACADINLESIDIIKQMLTAIEHVQVGDALHKPPQFSSMLNVLQSISEDKVKPADAWNAKVHQIIALTQSGRDETDNEFESGKPKNTENGSLGPEEASASKKTSSSKSEPSVRVSINRLDRLIDMVGELVIAHSIVAQDQAIPKDSELQKKVNHASKILRELQDTSLTLRMVPLKATFHKMNRLVRDLSQKAGKQVKFSTFGEDTEIDRNMVDIINEPLIHMLRNALDHGIENPEQRHQSGKNAIANIRLKASQEGGKVVIQIEDDGRGINKDIILKKAIEKGLIDPEKKLSENEIYGLIFLPGFSSTEVVTDLSGRGVGMDVVRRNIEQLHGKIDVSTELGKGTTITIELPFTLAITDGMLVRVGSQRFIVPTINIDMTFRAEEKDLFTMMGNSEQVSFRGQSVPVIRLHRLFDIHGAQNNLLEGTLMVIKNNNRRYALLVDEVVGQQQLVGKSINLISKTKHISGGAILGDGRVGLILDTAALIETAA